MFKKIIIGLIVIIAVFCAVAAMQPNEFSVTRSATIIAEPEQVFAQVNDLHQWQQWSPWAKMDPNAKISYEGPAAGEGAVFHWDGNSAVGAGSMTITQSHPSDLIRMRLDFLKPLPGVSTSEFTFTPEAGATKVTWSMHGTNNFVGKAIGLIMNCEKIVGEQFDQGLSNLKTVVEGKGHA